MLILVKNKAVLDKIIYALRIIKDHQHINKLPRNQISAVNAALKELERK